MTAHKREALLVALSFSMCAGLSQTCTRSTPAEVAEPPRVTFSFPRLANRQPW